MTAKELIAALSDYPEDTPVLTADGPVYFEVTTITPDCVMSDANIPQGQLVILV